jgi:hypothetical protein
MYTVFHRTWWKNNPNWPNGLEPCAGEKHFIGTVNTEQEAQYMCRMWNNKHDPGKLSDKAEYSD